MTTSATTSTTSESSASAGSAPLVTQEDKSVQDLVKHVLDEPPSQLSSTSLTPFTPPPPHPQLSLATGVVVMNDLLHVLRKILVPKYVMMLNTIIECYLHTNTS